MLYLPVMTTLPKSPIVLVLGSAPDAILCKPWPKSNVSSIVALNNAWRVRDDWDYLVAPDDFPVERRPSAIRADQRLIGSEEYVPANNLFGGVFYAGGTMAFSAGYWALAVLKPSVIAFLGCDMIYPNSGKSHFYGRGRSDPLRFDPSLRNLEAKSSRLMLLAERSGCACVRLSTGESRLVFPSARYQDLAAMPSPTKPRPNTMINHALKEERRLSYHLESGRYWEVSDSFSLSAVDAIDELWLHAAGLSGETSKHAPMTAQRDWGQLR